VVLTIWAVLASVLAMRSDGFGDVRQAQRNRHPEPFPRGR
jgi:hypothetical protein